MRNRYKEPSILKLLFIIGIIVLGAVILHQNGYARTISVDPGELADSLAVATAGDSLVLADGAYGNITANGLDGSVGNPIYIKAEHAGLATLDYIILTNSNYLYIEGVSVTPWSSGSYVVPPTTPIAPATGENGLCLIDISSSCSHIYLDGILAQATTSPFATLAAWQDSGFYAAILSYADSLTLDGCTFRDGRYNVSVYGDSGYVTGILSERFSEDGLRVGNYTTVDGVTVQNAYTPDTGYHGDLMQWSFGEAAYGITVQNSFFFATTPDRGDELFIPVTQGVFADQGTIGLVIQNNVIVCRESAWGIGMYNVHGGVIVNNTVAVTDTSNNTYGIFLLSEKNGGTTDSVWVAYNVAQQFWNEASGDSVYFWSNYMYNIPDMYSHNYAAQWNTFRDPSNNDFYAKDSTVVIVDPTDSTGYLAVSFPNTDIIGTDRDATPDIGAYEYVGAGGGTPAGEPRTWTHPTDLATQSDIDDSLNTGDTLLLERGATILTSLVIPTGVDSITIGTTGASGFAEIDGLTALTNWSVLTGGAVADTNIIKIASDSADVYNQYVGGSDEFNIKYTYGRQVGKIAGGDYPYRAAYMFDGDDLTGHTITGATFTLTVAAGTTEATTYAGHPFTLYGQTSAVGSIWNGTSFRAAFADSSTAHVDTSFADDGTLPNVYVLNIGTSLIQEVIDDADYADGKIRILMAAWGTNANTLKPLDYGDASHDSVATLTIYSTTVGGAGDDHLRYKVLTYTPTKVFIGGSQVSIDSDTANVAQGTTVAILGDTLWVDPADTSDVAIIGNIGIDGNSNSVINITGAGGLLLKNFNVSFADIVLANRVVVDSSSVIAGADSLYRLTGANADSANIASSLNALLYNVTATPDTTGTDTYITETALESDYSLAGLGSYAADGQPWGAVNYTLDAVTVKTPNGGETLTIGTSYNITWSPVGTAIDSVILYYGHIGVGWTAIDTVSSDSTYAWTVPDSADTDWLVRIVDASNIGVADQSNAVFTIQATITVILPGVITVLEDEKNFYLLRP